MLLAVDIGNTHIVLGIYDGAELRVEWSVATDPRKTHHEYGLLFMSLLEHHGFAPSDVHAVAMVSSVPPMVTTIEWMCQKYFHLKPLIIGPGVKTGVIIRYDNPREVSADRIVIAAAAFEKYGGPLIVVDFGSTATILDVISPEGEYLGGVIAPGISVSLEALFQQAAKLPRIELVRPQSALGTNTVHAMQAGVIFGFAGQVEALAQRLIDELALPGMRVVATGDWANLITAEVELDVTVDPYLSLDGLRIIHERNHSRGD
jgi:type III pantothenate kinase